MGLMQQRYWRPSAMALLGAVLVPVLLLAAHVRAVPRQLQGQHRGLQDSTVGGSSASECLRNTFTDAEAPFTFADFAAIVATHNQRDQNVFSQAGEDGILESIFACIETTDKYYVEFGVEAGVQCTTRVLRERHGWNGLMMDGGNSNEETNLKQELIYAENIVELFKKYQVPQTFDQLTVDIDLNTFWVLREILAAEYRPRSLTIEINRNLGPDNAYTTVYLPKDMWAMNQEGTTGTCYFGGSLMAYERLTAAFGYTLVALDTQGVNGFFVHKDATNGQPVFSHKQVVNNTRDKGTWDALHGYCHNTPWVEVTEAVNFKAKHWKKALRPVILRHVRSPDTPAKRLFLEMSHDSSVFARHRHSRLSAHGY